MSAPVFDPSAEPVGEPRPPRHAATVIGVAAGVAAACWLAGAVAGGLLLPAAGARFGWERDATELASMGVKYVGGLGLYLGALAGVTAAFRFAGRAEAATIWRRRFWSFHLTVLAICALGAALGALVFPLAGGLGGAHKTAAELARMGARTGGFFFMVWAPGFALVREFVRAARAKDRTPRTAGSPS